jgi:maleylacetate reductase
MHVPIETAREAREVARQLGADCAVAIGGGSTTGLGKAIALDSGLPILAIPTTYAGSEMTPIYGITEAGLKKTGKDFKVLPKSVLYDPQLTLSLPVGLSVTSGINAIAHAAEGLYSVEGNPVIDLMAEEGIAAIGRALPKIVANAAGCGGPWRCALWRLAVRHRAGFRWAWRCTTSSATPWAAASTCRMPRPTPWCCPMRWPTTPPPRRRPCSASRVRWVARTPGAQAVYDLARANGAPGGAQGHSGMKAEDLDRACDIAMQNQYPNPRPLQAPAIRHLLQMAWEGARPDA